MGPPPSMVHGQWYTYTPESGPLHPSILLLPSPASAQWKTIARQWLWLEAPPVFGRGVKMRGT